MKNINEMTVKELREVAKQYGIKNASYMTKEKLYGLCKEAVEAKEAEEAAAKAAKIEKEAKKEAKTKSPKKNGWQKIAEEQLRNAYNFIVGGLENAVQDGDMTEEELKTSMADNLDYIYTEAITTHYEPGFSGGEAPKEMRFATKEFCYNFIKQLYTNDGYTWNEPEKDDTKVNLDEIAKMTVKKLKKTIRALGFKYRHHAPKAELIETLKGLYA